MDLLEHPLAGLSRRRVILDCLALAFLKICLRLPSIVERPRSQLFSSDGLLRILKYIFPLREDVEDAQAAHDLLMKWIFGELTQPPFDDAYPTKNIPLELLNEVGT